jgi:hypothetical protein
MYVFMLYDVLMWLDVCSFECELGSWDGMEGTFTCWLKGVEQVPYLGYELSSEANADLYRIHDPCVSRRCTMMVPTYVHRPLKITLCTHTQTHTHI